jgi:hypothetical protein
MPMPVKAIASIMVTLSAPHVTVSVASPAVPPDDVEPLEQAASAMAPIRPAASTAILRLSLGLEKTAIASIPSGNAFAYRAAGVPMR